MPPKPKRVRIRNFESYQHYKDRRPPWVKLHRDFWTDLELTRQSTCARLLALGLVSLASETSNIIAWDADWIARRLHLPANEVSKSLAILLKIRFIEPISARNGASTLSAKAENGASGSPALTRADARSREAEAEREIEKGSTARTRRPVEKPASQQNGNGNVVEIYAVQELLKVLSDKDEGTAAVIASFHRKLSEGAFHYVRDRIREYEPHSPSAFAVAALSSMVERGEYAKVRAS